MRCAHDIWRMYYELLRDVNKTITRKVFLAIRLALLRVKATHTGGDVGWPDSKQRTLEVSADDATCLICTGSRCAGRMGWVAEVE